MSDDPITRLNAALEGHRLLLFAIFLLLLVGCGGDGVRTDPSIPHSCGDESDAAIATLEDTNLESAIRAALSLGTPDHLTCGLISRLTALDAFSYSAGIKSLVGIENLTSLTALDLGSNSITDISALSGLTKLIFLSLSNNAITDIGSLSNLTSLTTLDLHATPDLTDIQPLLDNPGLGVGDVVNLLSTSVSCADVAALEAKGVSVGSDCD